MDIIGKTFGYFTIIKDSGLRGENSGNIYTCRCKCGFIKNVSWKLLSNEKKPRSCGCSRKERSRLIFESNIVKTDSCWIWKGRFNRQGYGRIGTKSIAHRRSYEYYKGKIPLGKFVCHTCDNPACVNPDHLFLGSPKENSQDAVNKGRMTRGSRVKTSKLNEQIVLEIRQMRLQGKEYQEIADKFRISWALVCCICTNRQWKHVPLGDETKKFPQIRKHVRGEDSGSSVLNEEKVREIRTKLSMGEKPKALAKEYRVSYSNIRHILKNESWKHLV